MKEAAKTQQLQAGAENSLSRRFSTDRKLYINHKIRIGGLSWWYSGQESACQCKRHRSDPVREDSTCRGATKASVPQYWALNDRSPYAQSLCSAARGDTAIFFLIVEFIIYTQLHILPFYLTLQHIRGDFVMAEHSCICSDDPLICARKIIFTFLFGIEGTCNSIPLNKRMYLRCGTEVNPETTPLDTIPEAQ
ncbi:hypothetical protein MJG53_003032 [Ovis ammon polii x Ovis aries]|uniref:Uncharacterized protein n=1 Tax=Ovis ammon polii x Ovis aries TaxID=2918886 RepID=A0ACB9VGH7_9CETA|nr:hypothetical protein MJT46_004380 [Ovis ammon polii x Ovis aries]KAI4588624.1 hypothetical protein MJG53_003032 [Ovis ammon polii x Ovis aries]